MNNKSNTCISLINSGPMLLLDQFKNEADLVNFARWRIHDLSQWFPSMACGGQSHDGWGRHEGIHEGNQGPPLSCRE
jgi:hypothetical protein